MKYKPRKDLSIQVESKILYRIEALKDFGRVKCGDLGGYIESDASLSQLDNCWVYEDAKDIGAIHAYTPKEIRNIDSLLKILKSQFEGDD